MKKLEYYLKNNLLNDEMVFNHFKETILHSNRTWDYFINWEKVYGNVEKFNIELNILNSLNGSNKFDEELRFILNKYPEVIKVFPTLLGVRDMKFQVLDNSKLPLFIFKEYNFKKKTLNQNDIEEFIIYFKKSGLKDLIINGGLTNLRDYTFGVEVGFDTNGRKNRGGTIMESLVENILKEIYFLVKDKDYVTQGSPKKIKELWDLDLPVDKSSRRPDFIINKNNKLYWVETNFYSGGGSKLKSTCGEYKSLYNFCKSSNIEFIWITDGEGWKTTLKPLEETFIHNDYIFNLNMLTNNILNDVWS